MNKESRRRLRWWTRLRVAAIMLAVGVAVYAAVTAHWLWVLAAALVVGAMYTRPLVVLASLIAAVILGAWPAAVAASLAVLADLGIRLQLRFGRSPALDEAALAARVEGLSPGLRRRFESCGHRVDTAVLLRVAVEEDPARWPVLEPSAQAMTNSEGGLVAGTRWTVVAAEAVLAAAHRPDAAAAIDVHQLAAIAAWLPCSLAHNIIGNLNHDRRVMEAAGLTPAQVKDMILLAIKQPGGELLLPRMELAIKVHEPGRGQLLDESHWRALRAPMRQGDGHDEL